MRYELCFFLVIGAALASCTRSGDYVFEDRLRLNGYTSAMITQQSEHATTLEKNGTRLKVRSIRVDGIATARALIEMHIAEIFDPPPAPYPGYISNKVTCDADLRPVAMGGVPSANGFFNGWQFFANDRYTPGECNHANVKFEYYRGIISCPEKKNFFEVEFFSPAPKIKSDAALRALLKTVTCL